MTTEPDLTEAMEVWRRAFSALAQHGDQAAARVIATALEARDAYFREQLKVDEEILADYKEREAKQDARIWELEAALEEARRAIGDHFAPSDCYATGPLTGDPYRDLVVCPACSFIATHDTILTKQEPKA